MKQTLNCKNTQQIKSVSGYSIFKISRLDILFYFKLRKVKESETTRRDQVTLKCNRGTDIIAETNEFILRKNTRISNLIFDEKEVTLFAMHTH